MTLIAITLIAMTFIAITLIIMLWRLREQLLNAGQSKEEEIIVNTFVSTTKLNLSTRKRFVLNVVNPSNSQEKKMNKETVSSNITIRGTYQEIVDGIKKLQELGLQINMIGEEDGEVEE